VTSVKFWGGGEGISETPGLGLFLSHLTEHLIVWYGEDTNYVERRFHYCGIQSVSRWMLLV